MTANSVITIFALVFLLGSIAFPFLLRFFMPWIALGTSGTKFKRAGKRLVGTNRPGLLRWLIVAVLVFFGCYVAFTRGFDGAWILVVAVVLTLSQQVSVIIRDLMEGLYEAGVLIRNSFIRWEEISTVEIKDLVLWLVLKSDSRVRFEIERGSNAQIRAQIEQHLTSEPVVDDPEKGKS